MQQLKDGIINAISRMEICMTEEENIKNRKLKHNLLLIFTIIPIIFILLCFLFLSGKFDRTQSVENESIKEEIIKIVYITDNNYINHTLTSINSIKANKNPNTNIIINILGNNLSPEEINKIKNEQTDTVKINLIPIEIQHKTDNFKISNVTRYITKIVYTKFILASLFPNENKILYLDSDTLILKDLSSLYNIDLQDSYAGVADDWEMGWYDHRIARYFNDGIMLLNLKKMREDNIEYKLYKYKQTKDKNRFKIVLIRLCKTKLNTYHLYIIQLTMHMLIKM